MFSTPTRFFPRRSFPIRQCSSRAAAGLCTSSTRLSRLDLSLPRIRLLFPLLQTSVKFRSICQSIPDITLLIVMNSYVRAVDLRAVFCEARPDKVSMGQDRATGHQQAHLAARYTYLMRTIRLPSHYTTFSTEFLFLSRFFFTLPAWRQCDHV